jgi:preprotein translocase subunit YajC
LGRTSPKDRIVNYLMRKSKQTTKRHASGILDDLEEGKYVETVSGDKGELVRFTDKTIN